MIAIKLRRIGKKHQPAYRVIVSEKRSKVGGRYVEDIGWFNPLLRKSEFKKERAQYWLGVGAQPTVTVHNLFVNAGITEGKKRAAHSTKKRKKEEAEAAPPASAETPTEGKATVATGEKTETPAETVTEAPAEEPKAETSNESEAEKTENTPKAEEEKPEEASKEETTES